MVGREGASTFLAVGWRMLLQHLRWPLGPDGIGFSYALVFKEPGIQRSMSYREGIWKYSAGM